MSLHTQPILNLNRSLPWTKVLAALDVFPEHDWLPSRVRCPVCDGSRLTIYDDTTLSGAWHYCFDCRSAGDMVDLAASAWAVSVETAARNLTRYVAPVDGEPPIEGYLEKYAAPRRRTHKFWAAVRDHLKTSPSPLVNKLLNKFGLLNMHLSGKRWLDTMGNFIGSCAYHDVERLFRPRCMVGNRCPSDARLFRGPGWSDVLVIPFHDLPGRICGLCCVGRRGERKDIVYERTMKQPLVPEGGLACYWAVENSHRMLGDRVVAVGDPLLALRLHLRHFATGNTALPLVAYADFPTGRTRHAWKALHDRRPVLWGWKMTPGLLHQAMLADGQIVLSELEHPTRKNVNHMLRKERPKELLRGLVARALPWREALKRWLARSHDSEVEGLLAGLESYGTDRAELLHVSTRVEGFVREKAFEKTIMFGPAKIVERPDGLWKVVAKGPERRVTNFTFKTFQAVMKQDQPWYVGTLTVAGQDVGFEYRAKAVPNGRYVLAALQTAIARVQPGKALYVAPGWSGRRISALAALLCPPTP